MIELYQRQIFSDDEEVNTPIEEDDLLVLKYVRLKNPKNILLGYINVNSIRNKLNKKFYTLFGNTFDFFVIAESKLDDSFPSAQFELSWYKSSPYRLEKTSKSGGLLIYVNKNIPSRQLKGFPIRETFQIVPIELNLRKLKWLIVSIYRPPDINLNDFLACLSNLFDFYSNYDRIIVMGDFNSEPDGREISEFL